MNIRRVVILDDRTSTESSIFSRLKQLGLQISHYSYQGPDCLTICSRSFDNDPLGRAQIHYALSRGSPIIFDDENSSQTIDEISNTGNLCEETRKSLEVRALYRCLEKEAMQLETMQKGLKLMPPYIVQAFEKVQDLRYGENWHQKAALYRRSPDAGLYDAKKLNGKEISYNNVVDSETALEMLIDLSQYDCIKIDKALSVIIKHANPCGVAYGNDLQEAYRLSFATDPKSAFGGVIGFNRTVDVETAQAIGDSFVEVLLAPGYEPEALRMLMNSKPNRRIFDIGNLLERQEDLYKGWYLKNIFGGIMLQDYDTSDLLEWNVVTRRMPTESESRALRFAWKIAKYVKSNALVYATENRTIGIGSGQVSRVDSARFGAEKAAEHGLSTRGTVGATDSFFPFRDGLDQTFKAGATAVIHPGGSVRDAEVIDAANEHNMAMVFTGMRHFRH